MLVFIDTEFNEFKGDLISIALVAEDGREFYASVGCDNPGPWVSQNVMPIIGIEPVPMEVLQAGMQRFLWEIGEPIHIVADWPEDISHFCQALIIGPGVRLNTRALTMEVDGRLSSASSAVLHNALHDARAIRDHWRQIHGFSGAVI